MADFWTLVAMRALYVTTIPSQNSETPAAEEEGTVYPPLDFLMGRVDCPGGWDNDDHEGTIPLGVYNWTQVHEVFGPQGFNFTVQEIVAILGAHSIGTASPLNAGFQGQWDLTPGYLDNSYYSTLADASNLYVSVPVNSSIFMELYQWNATIDHPVNPANQRMMMNSDVSLLFNFPSNPKGQV